MHEHALIWVHSGTKTLLSGATAHVFDAGHSVVMHQGSVWDVINDPSPGTRYEATVIQFGDEALNAFAEVNCGVMESAAAGYAAPRMNEELVQSIRRAVDTICRPGASPALQRHRAVEVLLLLAEQGIRLEPYSELPWSDRIRRLVAQRPCTEWSVDVLAAAFHISSATLRRRLAVEGARARDIVRETRLETGLTLLQTTTMGVGEIAFHCGYESHSRFSAAFRERFGFSPSKLRVSANDSALSDSAQ